MRVPLPRHKTEADWIIVGQIGAPYGIKGWNHIRSFTRPLERLFDYSPWYLQQKDGWDRVTPEESRRQGEGWVVKLEGIVDRDRAALLTQKWIAIHRDQREAVSEAVFYWADLEGLMVERETGEKLGRVKYLYENTGIDVMLIEHEGKEYHIPFIMHDTVLKVDQEKGCIIVDWVIEHPEG